MKQQWIYPEEEYIDDYLEDNRPSISNVTDTNRINGVRNYIKSNGDHIIGFYKKETQYDSIDQRVNKIIRYYSKRKDLKKSTIKISNNFKEFKTWFKKLKNIPTTE